MSKMTELSISQNMSKLRKTTKVIKLRKTTKVHQIDDHYDQFASIWRPNDQKCWVTSQTIQNNAKLQKWSKYNDLHRFDVKTIKATQNSKRDQITMNLHRFDVQTIKNVELRRKPFKTTLNYKSEQNTMTFTDLMSKTSKQQKWSNYMNFIDLMFKRSEQRKTTKVIKLRWICIDLTSKRSIMSR